MSLKKNRKFFCRVCGSSNYFFKFFVKNTNFKFKKYKYFECNDCQSLFLNYTPKNLKNFYSQKYSPFQTDKGKEKIAKCSLKIITSIIRKGRIIEIGPGSGSLINSLFKKKFTCYAVEQDKKSSKRLKDITVFNNKLELMKPKIIKKKMNMIISIHSLEHLENLKCFLKFCSSIISKNGTVFITTPNINSLSFMFYQNFWYHMEAPRHLFLIKENYLDKKFSEIGFKKILSSKKNYNAYLSSKFGWETSGYYVYKNNGLKIFSYIGKLLSVFMPFIELIFNRTSEYTAVYKKIR